MEVRRADGGIGPQPVGHHLAARSVPEIGEVAVVRIQDRDRRLLDEHRLGGTICVQRAVELEVLTGQVGHDGDIESAVAHPRLRQAVRGRLHHHAVVARRHHVGQQGLELERLRRRIAIRVRQLFVADPDGHRPCQARPPAGRTEHGCRQKAGRRLPVRARHPDHVQVLGWSTEPRIRGVSQRDTRLRHDQLRKTQAVQLVLCDECHCTPLPCLRGECRGHRRDHRERRRTGRRH